MIGNKNGTTWFVKVIKYFSFICVLNISTTIYYSPFFSTLKCLTAFCFVLQLIVPCIVPLQLYLMKAYSSRNVVLTV